MAHLYHHDIASVALGSGGSGLRSMWVKINRKPAYASNMLLGYAKSPGQRVGGLDSLIKGVQGRPPHITACRAFLHKVSGKLFYMIPIVDAIQDLVAE